MNVVRIALSIALASLPLACDGGSAPPPPPAAPAEPAFSFDPEVVRFGELMPERPESRIVRVRNDSAVPRAITDAITDCPCTSASFPSEPIAPGETVEVEITIDPGQRQGVELGKKIAFVTGGDGDDRVPVWLRVEASVPLFIRVSTETLDAPADDEADPAPTEVSLEAVDGTAFRVEESDPAGVVAPGGEPATRTTCAIDWSAWRDAGRPRKITVYTDHPAAPPLAFTVRRAAAPRSMESR